MTSVLSPKPPAAPLLPLRERHWRILALLVSAICLGTSAGLFFFGQRLTLPVIVLAVLGLCLFCALYGRDLTLLTVEYEPASSGVVTVRGPDETRLIAMALIRDVRVRRAAPGDGANEDRAWVTQITLDGGEPLVLQAEPVTREAAEQLGTQIVRQIGR